MKDLPIEIIVDILSRLPVKSVGRFRCVSKLWLSAISDPQFVKLHHNRALNNPDIYSQRQRLIFSCHNLYSIEYQVIGCDNNDLEAIELEYPLKNKPNGWMGDGYAYNFFSSSLNLRNWVEILGSCNGLVCIVPRDDTLFLFNPSTRESYRIPNPPAEMFPAICNYNVYGFGYDYVNDDYKLVRLAGEVAVGVYSLRYDSWKRIEKAPYSIAYEAGRQLKGAIHWVVSATDDLDNKCMIAVFDLQQELFREMPAPDVVGNSSDFVVGVLDDCLCLLHSYGEMRNEFWMMKEYGVGESWTRFEISILYICMNPLCRMNNNEVLLEIDGKLVMYNFKDDTCRDLVISSLPAGVGFEAYTYLESLVSPNAHRGSGG